MMWGATVMVLYCKKSSFHVPRTYYSTCCRIQFGDSLRSVEMMKGGRTRGNDDVEHSQSQFDPYWETFSIDSVCTTHCGLI